MADASITGSSVIASQNITIDEKSESESKNGPRGMPRRGVKDGIVVGRNIVVDV